MAVRASTSRSRIFTASIRELAALSDAALLLDLEGTVLFVNEAWERLASAAGRAPGPAVGTAFADCAPGEEPRAVLRSLVASAARGPAHPVFISGELNSPETARLVTMQMQPLVAGGESMGVTVVCRVVRELPAGEVYPVVEGKLESYLGEVGALVQCCCCRRTRRPADPEEWDFVPLLVAVPPADALFVYCPLCRELHRPPAAGAHP